MSLTFLDGRTEQLSFIQDFLEGLGLADWDICLTRQEGTGFSLKGEEKQATISFRRLPEALRALLALSQGELELKEAPVYGSLAYMADCSRNAVLTVEAAKKMIRLLARMGYTRFELYMEDVYELWDQPYFGYFRGRYSLAELREIEATCALYEMDFVPCIQTLAHLHSFLRWQVKEVQAMRDLDDILLVGAEGTARLIDQIFDFFSGLETRTINIGMDEAYLLGLGNYLHQNGVQDRALIMCQHLEMVLDRADRHGFHCQMWSDMFFKLLAPTGHFDSELVMSEEVAARVEVLKQRVTMIYWDYYQTDTASYERNLRHHAQLSDDVIFASGAWKWTGFTPHNGFSHRIAVAANQALRAQGTREVVVTGWGDNGGEASQFSVLPSLQVWAELAYRNQLDRLETNFQAVTGAALEDFLLIDRLDDYPGRPKDQSGINPSRYLFYQDILCPLLDRHIPEGVSGEKFRQDALAIEEALPRLSAWSELFECQRKLAVVLSLKTDLAGAIRSSYDQADLRSVVDHYASLCGELLSSIESFHESFSKQWMTENKVFGLDTMDLRIGGLLQRVKRARQRLLAYGRGEIDRIEELEEELLVFNDFMGEGATSANQWQLLATASTLYTT